MENIVGLAAVFIMIGFTCSVCALHMRSRRAMMRLRWAGSIFYIIYFYLKDAYAGVFGAIISAIGAAVQVLTPDHLHEKTLYLRTAIAVFLATGGIWVFAGSTGIYPMMAVIIVRLCEVQSCVQRIRFGILAGQCCWLAYSIDLQILPFIMTESCLILSNLWATWKHYRVKKAEMSPAV